MTSPYDRGNGLPTGLPPEVIQGLVNQLITPTPAPGTEPGGPVTGSAPVGAQPAAVLAPGGPPPPGGPTPVGPPGGPPPGGPPGQGGPTPGSPPGPGQEPPDKEGLNDQQAEMLKTLMSDPKAREQIGQILKKIKESKKGGANPIDPATMLSLAQGWNARVAGLALQVNAARSQNPGATTASDEALLRIYYQTPLAPWAPPDEPFPIPLADIDEYADAVRLHLVKAGWDNIDKIEDQVVRECFPLREPLIAAGRGWQARVDFADQMHSLTERWLDKYGHLPVPDMKVYEATKQGKGDPESQARDTDSSAYPPGGFNNPPSGVA